MEESKEIKVRLSTVIIILLLIILIVMGYFLYTLYTKTLEQDKQLISLNSQIALNSVTEAEEDIDNEDEDENISVEDLSLETVLDKIYISQKFVRASDEFKKELFASCNNTTAKLNTDGKLEITIDKEKFIVNEIDDEIIDLKLGIVNQHDGKDDINTSFVRDVFVLTKAGDVYAVNITYGYRPDLISKILSDVVKLENVQRKGMYNDTELWDSVVVAKVIDGTIAICDDGERDGL